MLSKYITLFKDAGLQVFNLITKLFIKGFNLHRLLMIAILGKYATENLIELMYILLVSLFTFVILPSNTSCSYLNNIKQVS